MNSIPTTTMCPSCAESGEKNRLNRLLVDGKLVCQKEHKFDTLEEVEAYTKISSSSPITEAPVESKRLVPKVTAAPRQEAAAVEEKPFQMTSLPNPPKIEADTPKVVEAPPPTKPVTSETTMPTPAGAKPNGSAIAIERIRKPVPLPGGDMLITVRIPDGHVSFLKAEAELKGKTIQEYFEETVQFGLDAGWFT